MGGSRAAHVPGHASERSQRAWPRGPEVGEHLRGLGRRHRPLGEQDAGDARATDRCATSCRCRRPSRTRRARRAGWPCPGPSRRPSPRNSSVRRALRRGEPVGRQQLERRRAEQPLAVVHAAAGHHPDERPQVVERGHQPAGGVVHRRRRRPPAASHRPGRAASSPSSVGAYAVVNRPIDAGGTWKPVSTMPSGRQTRSSSSAGSGRPVARSSRTPATCSRCCTSTRRRVGPSAAAWRSGGSTRRRRSTGGGHGGPSVHSPSSRSACWIGSPGPPQSRFVLVPKPSRNESRSSTVIGRSAGDGVVERRADRRQHPAIGQLRQVRVDAVVEAQHAVVDEHHRQHGDDRLGDRGDAEDRVALQRRRVVDARRPEHGDVDTSVPCATRATRPGT